MKISNFIILKQPLNIQIMAINDHRKDKKKSNEAPDFSKDTMLEFHNNHNLKDLNSEAVTSKESEETKNRGEDMGYINRSAPKTAVIDALSKKDTGSSPEQ